MKMNDYIIILPDYIEFIISELEKKGFEGYVVGGSVRDSVMTSTPHDYDITTNASPMQVHEIFEKTCKIIDTGIKFGTVTVISEGNPVEITTFRTEADYSDYRRPEKIEFTSNLKLDLSRRDFTVNALAYCGRTGLVDYFNGKEDIKNKIIRCIGNPDDRFGEDALRILRALRFSAKLDFSIEENTKKSLNKNAFLLKNIAAERIYTEIYKMFEVKNQKRINLIFLECRPVFEVIYPEFSDFSDREYRDFSSAVSLLSGDAKLCLVYIASILKLDDKRMSDLKFEKSIKNNTKLTVLALEYLKKTELLKTDFALSAAKYGENAALYASKIIDAEKGGERYAKTVKNLILHECISLKQLDINGNDLNLLGISGEKVSEILHFLLESVILNRCRNNKPDLIEYYKNSFEKRR